MRIPTKPKSSAPVPTRRARLGGKIAVLCDELRTLAHQRGPEAKMPTATELCDQFGTSPSTLNTVLKELEQQNVIYRKWGVGIFVSPQLHRKSVRILLDASVVYDPGTSPFWGMLMGFCITEAQRRGESRNEDYRFQIVPSVKDQDQLLPDEILLDVEEGRIDGILTIGLNTKVPAQVDSKLPLVAFGGDGYWHVGTDHRDVLRFGVDALAGQGCSRIGLWQPSDLHTGDVVIEEEILERFQTELNANKRDFNSGLVKAYRHIPNGTYRGSYQQQGYMLAMDVFSRDRSHWPDGILLMDDMLTSGMLFAFQELGLRANRDVKIAALANAGSTVLFGHEKYLTRIEVEPREIALKMYDTLDILIRGEQPASQMEFVTPVVRPPFEHPGMLPGY